MKHEIHEKQGACVVAFKGEVDLESSPEAREILLKCFENTDKVLVDLSSFLTMDNVVDCALIVSLLPDNEEFIISPPVVRRVC